MSDKPLNEIIKELRNHKGLTQEQLAEIMGVSPKTISRWETGEVTPPLEVLDRIADALGVEFDSLLPQSPPLQETFEEQWDRIRKTRNRAQNANLLLFLLRANVLGYGLGLVYNIVNGNRNQIFGGAVRFVLFLALTALAMLNKDKLDRFFRKHMPDGATLLIILLVLYFVLGLGISFVYSVIYSIKNGLPIF